MQQFTPTRLLIIQFQTSQAKVPGLQPERLQPGREEIFLHRHLPTLPTVKLTFYLVWAIR